MSSGITNTATTCCQPSVKTTTVPPVRWKEFVRAKSPSPLPPKNIPQVKKYSINVPGENINDFYLNVVSSTVDESNGGGSEDDDVIFDGIIQRKEPKKSSRSNGSHFPNARVVHQAMKYAQLNDINNLKGLIEAGLSVNVVDEYGWSLLMVAAYAGSVSVVKYLMEKKAKKGKRDSKGNTAIYLASQNGHKDIVELLIKSKKGKPCFLPSVPDKKFIPSDDSVTNKYFCKDCNYFSECPKRKHETSITHLLKQGPGNIEPFYGIPRKNKGFQMLVQQGWNTYQGLGPDGLGKKYPIKTKLKKDRLGIGHVDELNAKEAVAAHLEQREKPQRKEKLRPLSRKRTSLLKKREKLKEISIRRALNDPDI